MIWDGAGHLNTGGTSAKSSSMVVLRVGEGSAKVETSAGVDTDPEAVHNTGAQHFVLLIHQTKEGKKT